MKSDDEKSYERGLELPALKRAILAVKDLRSRLSDLERLKREPIAVVGMACRFPGKADCPEAYWRLLRDGKSGVGEVPSTRWNVDECYDPDPEVPGKMYTRHGALVDAVDRFDASFFGISPREAAGMDPQHRLLLEVSWEALENAGQAPGKYANAQTAVFVGISTSDYLNFGLHLGDLTKIDAYLGTGGAFSIAAGRLSYVMGLHGPNLAVDTACSFFAGGHTPGLSEPSNRKKPSGTCGRRESDVVPRHDGGSFQDPGPLRQRSLQYLLCLGRRLCPGEGCGIVVLKRLSDALADRDRILACSRCCGQPRWPERRLDGTERLGSAGRHPRSARQCRGRTFRGGLRGSSRDGDASGRSD